MPLFVSLSISLSVSVSLSLSLSRSLAGPSDVGDRVQVLAQSLARSSAGARNVAGHLVRVMLALLLRGHGSNQITPEDKRWF